jgi:2-oxoglutarate ferredoxin oxidoreductase subunit gamma
LEYRIIIAGAGGQGTLFLGKVLAQAGMIEGKQVTWFPSYGAEMRGGTANCTVILSDEMIGSPVVFSPDILIAMNRASVERFQPQLKKKGLLLFDSSLISGIVFRENVVSVGIPATQIAGSLGNTKAANMVMLGALLAKTALLKKSSVDRLFSFSSAPAKDRAAEINKNSILEGIRYFEDKKSSHR